MSAAQPAPLRILVFERFHLPPKVFVYCTLLPYPSSVRHLVNHLLEVSCFHQHPNTRYSTTVFLIHHRKAYHFYRRKARSPLQHLWAYNSLGDCWVISLHQASHPHLGQLLPTRYRQRPNGPPPRVPLSDQSRSTPQGLLLSGADPGFMAGAEQESDHKRNINRFRIKIIMCDSLF